MATQVHSCSNTDCKVAEDGKCVEGYPLDECPHHGKLSVEELEPAVETSPPVQEIHLIALASGEPLNGAEAGSIKRQFRSRVIGVVGPNDSGKTSLIASLYDLLQVAPIGDVAFAGSSTLVGLEKACHDARAASRRAEPYTERTRVGGDATFYHVDVRGSGFDDVLSILIGDRSGEDYLRANDDISNADEFFELRNADVVTLLVNGAHLVDGQFRHEAKAVTPQIIAALIEAGVLSSRQRLAIVLTKNDLVQVSPNAERAEIEFQQMVEGVRTQHKETISVVEAFVIAASPKCEGKTKRGDGVKALLDFWIAEVPPDPAQEGARPARTRMVDLFTSGGLEKER